ncbi:MAG TPA: hypothetical protein PLM41_20870 [Saprospiraceae bacterium]|nr:hypothetical protein [Saprospiraceae bacterium]
MRTHLFMLILFLKTGALCAQESLASAQPFFDGALQTYQKWLDGCGLGPALQVRSAEVKNDTLLVVFMGFQVADPDSARAVWERLRIDFARRTGGDSLETRLFEKIAWYFEVPPEQARLYLRDSYTGPKALCWEARVLPGGAKKAPLFQQKTLDCGFKSQEFQVNIGPQDLPGLRAIPATEFQKRMTKRAVFDKLKPWLTTRYQKKQPDGGWSHILFTDEWQNLKFEVDDLRREVISDASSSWLCEVLCQCATCLPYERMEAVIKYEPLEDRSGGFNITATISAKYGSGIWKPRGGGWHDLDDEPAKKALLKSYGELLMSDIKRYLLQP